MGMFVFLISLSLFLSDLSFNNGDLLQLEEDNDVYDTLFGNIGSMADLFLKEPGDPAPKPAPESVPTAADNDTFDEPDLEIADVFGFLRTNLTNQTFDILDFFIINEKYSDFTKEYKNRNKTKVKNNTRRSYVDPDDEWYGESIEQLKQQQLQMILVQFTMHCRYEVGKALIQRDFVRDDKRYKLGYLFNRMRRLKTEQLKMVGMAIEQNLTYYRHMYSLMRLYERVVHFDVDMRDTANIIKDVYRQDAYYDTFIVPKKKRVKADDDQKKNGTK